MNIRPHHLLCIQKFTGHGYNPDFTARMDSIVSELSKHPDTGIIVAQGCDDVCEACPNKINGVCTSLEKVTFMDSAVLKLCNLTYGEEIPWTTAVGKAWERIFETEEFNNICAFCQWFQLCRGTRREQ